LCSLFLVFKYPDGEGDTGIGKKRFSLGALFVRPVSNRLTERPKFA
jgi:hypothetical protein